MNYSELKEFFSFVAEKVNPIIRELLSSYVSEKNKEVVLYQVSTGGKKFRPALAVASCRMLGGELEDVLYPAASLEILHNYSLIIDDMIDYSKVRRTKPTLWARSGRGVAEIISVDYPAALFQGASISKKPAELAELFAKTLKILVDGELLDIFFELIKTSCETGGLIAGASEKELESLREYGFNLGIAFQIQDDYLDIFGEEEVFGKKQSQDIEEGKLGNVVISIALSELSDEERERFLQIMRKEKKEPKDILEGMDLIKKTTAKERAAELENSFVSKAKESLSLLPDNEWRDILFTIADFVMGREK